MEKLMNNQVEVTRDDVTAFIDSCYWLQILYGHFKTLYVTESEEDKLKLQLLENTAHEFFKDIQYILIGQIILQVCKITDPENAPNKRKNLTTEFFLNNINWDVNAKEELQIYSERIQIFRRRIETARNRRVSHIDREAALSDKNLGGFIPGEFEKFLEDLEGFVGIVYNKCFEGICPLNVSPDTESLIKALKQSTYFEALTEMDHVEPACYEVESKSKYKAV